MTNYYVAKTGNNGNSGLIGFPKLTIAAGIALLASGDFLYIGDGIYIESARLTIPANVSILAQNRLGVIMRPTGGSFIFQINQNNITIDGIDADAVNCTGSPFVFTNGGAGVSGLTIQYCRARNGNGDPQSSSGIIGVSAGSCLITHNIANNNDTGTTFDHGIYVSGTDVEISHNECFSNGAYGLHLYSSINNSRIFSNRIYNNARRGVIMYGSNNLFYNNLIYNNAWGMEFAGNSNGIYNNTLYSNGSGSFGIWLSTGSGNAIKNNILYANTQNIIQNDGSSTDSASNTLASSNPFVAGDLRLSADITGINLSAFFTTDYDDVTRSAPWSQGAYEFGTLTVAALSLQLQDNANVGIVTTRTF